MEIELKLQLRPEHIDRFRRSRVLSKAGFTEVDIDNVYFDTADRLLQRHQMTLRVRRLDGGWLQTLKQQATSGAVSHRGEWETPARVVGGQGRINLARLSESPLPALLAKQNSAVRLQPMFQTHVRRTQWIVTRGDATIEVALDIGEITAVAAQGALRETICEVELEVKHAPGRRGPTALVNLALELLDDSGKATPALTPVVRSKADRGYQLVAQQPPAAVKASARAFVENVGSKSTTATAMRAVLAHGLGVLTANVECLLRYGDPEYVHQSRVALRRVRSAIRLLDSEQKDVPGSLVGELRWFASALGEARDWDVITNETLPSLIANMGLDGAKPLVARADARRRQAGENVRTSALSARYGALVLNGEKWSLTTAPADAELLTAVAAPSLQAASKKLFKAARFFTALTPERRHQVRILAKRLRYALDTFAVVLPKRATARYVAALSDLQDALGELNDASVATTVLPQLTQSSRIRKAVQQSMKSVESGRVRSIEEKLLKLSKLETPWAIE